MAEVKKEIPVDKKEIPTENITIETEVKKKKIPTHNWAIATYIFAILSTALIVTIVINNNGFSLTGNAISSTEMETLAGDFITSKLVPEAEINGVSQESGLYVVNVTMQGETLPVYFTKDGNYIMQGRPLIPLATTTGTPTTTPTTAQPENIPKTDKPKIELYVMSFCPYGNRAEDTLMPVYNLLKNKIDFNVHYIVSVDSSNKISSLHGQPEVDEDEREACVLKDYGIDKWWVFATYVNTNCGNNGVCWQDAAKAAGIDVNAINTCVTSNGLALMKANAQASDNAGATGSPTMIINGIQTNSVYQYGNSEAYKTAICSAFTTAPAECSQALATSSSATTTSTGSCAAA